MKTVQKWGALAMMSVLSACHGPETECPSINKPNAIVRVNAKFKTADGDLLENETVKAYAVVFKKDMEADPVVYEAWEVSTNSSAEATIEFENRENIDETDIDDVVVQFVIRPGEKSRLEAVIQKSYLDEVKMIMDQVTCAGSASCTYVTYATPDQNCRYSRGDLYTIPELKEVTMEGLEYDTGGRIAIRKNNGLDARAREAIERYRFERGQN